MFKSVVNGGIHNFILKKKIGKNKRMPSLYFQLHPITTAIKIWKINRILFIFRNIIKRLLKA